MPKTYKLSWDQHPRLHEIDLHVANTFSQQTSREWDGAWKGTECIKDFKHTAKYWVEERIGEWQEVLDMIEALPNDEKQEHEYDEETEELVE